jgi:hypothetical protein
MRASHKITDSNPTRIKPTISPLKEPIIKETDNGYSYFAAPTYAPYRTHKKIIAT